MVIEVSQALQMLFSHLSLDSALRSELEVGSFDLERLLSSMHRLA